MGFDTTSVLESPQLSQQADDLSNPFGQMSLSRQGSTEASDPSAALFQPPLISQHPQQTSFIMASTGQPLPSSNYSTSSHAPPTQQVLPPQGYMQPPQQVSSSGSQLKLLMQVVQYCNPSLFLRFRLVRGDTHPSPPFPHLALESCLHSEDCLSR